MQHEYNAGEAKPDQINAVDHLGALGLAVEGMALLSTTACQGRARRRP
jgi:hypothetical protein